VKRNRNRTTINQRNAMTALSAARHVYTVFYRVVRTGQYETHLIDDARGLEDAEEIAQAYAMPEDIEIINVREDRVQ